MVRNNILRDFSFVLVCCIQCLVADNNKLNGTSKMAWNTTAIDRLKQGLLMHYDKFARPAQHYNTTTVSVGMSVLHVELNEFKNTFTVHGWLQLLWNDEKLNWNVSEYDGLDELHVGDHEIWQPDIVASNSATGTIINQFGNTPCIVYQNGIVLWIPLVQLVVFCQLDLRFWPFDTQTCSVKLGSWTYHGEAVNLKLGFQTNTKMFDDELLVRNTEWELKSITGERNLKTYKCCIEPFVDITFNMTVRRRSPTYKAIIITPAFAVIVMTLLNFWLPPQAGEKILLNCTTIAIICLFLLYFSQKCPAMGDHVPLIVLFYSSSLYLISFSMIGSVIVIWIARTQHHRSLPWLLKHALTGWLGRWLGLSSCINQSSILGTGSVPSAGEELREQLQHGGHVVDLSNHGGDDISDECHMLETTPGRYDSGSRHHDWLLLAAAIDRISFVFYALLFVILVITYSV